MRKGVQPGTAQAAGIPTTKDEIVGRATRGGGVEDAQIGIGVKKGKQGGKSRRGRANG